MLFFSFAKELWTRKDPLQVEFDAPVGYSEPQPQATKPKGDTSPVRCLLDHGRVSFEALSSLLADRTDAGTDWISSKLLFKT